MPPAATLDDTTVSALRALVADLGVSAAATRIGVDRSAVMRALAGLGVRRGTAVLIRLGLSEVKP